MSRPGALAVAVALALPLPAAGGGLRCAGGIVSIGDSKLDLLAKCGPPALTERRSEELSFVDPRTGFGRRVIAPAETWFYDFGPDRLVQVVTLRRGRVRAVENGGYGYGEAPPAPERPRKATCDPAVLSVGRSKLEVLARCGEPTNVDAWDEVFGALAADGVTLVEPAVVHTVEVWTYDFGPGWLVRYARFDGGEITRVESGGYGYGD